MEAVLSYGPYGPTIRYRCFNDCRQEGCPGHYVKVIYYGTADIVEVHTCETREEADTLNPRTVTKQPMLFDPNAFRAMVRSWERIR